MNPRIPEITAELQRINRLISNTPSQEELLSLLGKLKLQAAQLYLETDMEIIAQQRAIQVPSEEEPVEEEQTQWEPVKEEIVEESTADLSTEELQETQEITLEEPENTVEEAKVQQESHQESLFEDNEVLEEQVAENQDSESDEPIVDDFSDGIKDRAKEVLNMFSFSRRFEFGNFLFAGDMQLFTVFICEMLTAHPGEDRDQVYQKWYDNRNWSRKEESADDLRRNLKKMI